MAAYLIREVATFKGEEKKKVKVFVVRLIALKMWRSVTMRSIKEKTKENKVWNILTQG